MKESCTDGENRFSVITIQPSCQPYNDDFHFDMLFTRSITFWQLPFFWFHRFRIYFVNNNKKRTRNMVQGLESR